MALLKINLNFNQDELADLNDAKLYRKLDHNIKVKEMITQSLNNVFRQLDPKLVDDCEGQVKYLLDLANNTKNCMQSIAILDTTKLVWLANGDWSEKSKKIHSIKDLYDWCNEKKESTTRPLSNVCFLFQLPNAIINDYNTICFFCNLQFIYDEAMCQLSLDLKRIELINLKEPLSKKQFTLNLNKEFKYLDNPEVIESILTWKQLITDDNKNLDAYLHVNDWKRFLAAAKEYYKNKSTQKKDCNGLDSIFWLQDTYLTLGKSYTCYILQPKTNPIASFSVSSSKQYYLIKKQVLKKPSDIPDVYYNVYINFKQDNQLNNLIKEINQECIAKNKTLLQLSEELKDKQAQLKNIQSSMQELVTNLRQKQTELSQIKSLLTNLNLQVVAKQNQVNEINNQLRPTNFNEVTTITNATQVFELNNQLDNANNELSTLKNKYQIVFHNHHQLNLIVQQLTNQVATNQTRMQELDQEINQDRMIINTYKQANDKYSSLINTLKNDNYDCKKISFVLADEQHQVFEPFMVNSSIKSFFNGFLFSNYYFDEFNFWGAVNTNRLNSYLYALLEGAYKNPFLLQKIINPQTLKVKIDHQINPIIKNNFQLNKLQLEAIKKAINIEDYFYLQGPPGTGKTQTICAIANQYAIEHKTILMASQSHEAINNFFDRLDDTNDQNPKLMLVKYIPDKQKEMQNKYNVDSSWQRFLQKSMNYCKDPHCYLKDLKVIDKWIADNNTLPAFFTNQELTYLKNNNQFIKQSLNLTRFEKVASDYAKAFNKHEEFDEELFNLINNKQQSKVGSSSWLSQYDVLVEKWTKATKQHKIFNDLVELKNAYLAICNHNEYIDLFQHQYLDQVPKQVAPKAFNFFHLQTKEKEKKQEPILVNKLEFIDFINKNKLINVFGITMAASATISILKANDSDLFYDWPIDLVIIDEISKSTIPEIIGRILLAKKVVFAGDYKQLPPMCEYNLDECKQLVANADFNRKFTRWGGKVYDPDSEDDEQKATQLQTWLNDLYQTSFFKKEVSTLKHEHHLATVPYQFLTEQHRFCASIMNVVNTFYDDNEKLSMPEPCKIFNEYSLNLLSKQNINQTLADPCIIMDTSYLDENTQAFFLNKYNIKSKISFDTTNWDSNAYTSHINPYNAMVIINLIYQLLTNNPNLHPNQIGVITMTKSQKKLIDLMLKNKIETSNWNESWKEVKIDTVDNFQGREKEIIILDFVRSYGTLNGTDIEQKPRDVRFYFVNERNNVAISRAQAKLIIVGSFANHYLDLKTITNNEGMKAQYEFLKQIYHTINKKVATKDIVWPKM